MRMFWKGFQWLGNLWCLRGHKEGFDCKDGKRYQKLPGQIFADDNRIQDQGSCPQTPDAGTTLECLQDTPCPGERFIVSDGQTVGIANTIKRYQENRPVTKHSTPFEKRVEQLMLEEEEYRAKVSTSDVDGGGLHHA